MTARITGNRWLRAQLPALANPDLWHMNRRSTARAVAIGLVCGLLRGPLQSVGAAFACVALRGNVPLALVTSFYTNPLTIVPLYVVAYHFGKWVVPATRHVPLAAPPDLSFDLRGLTSFLHWAVGMGPTLAVGLPMLALVLGVTGFIGVNLAWRRRAALRAS